MSCGGVGESYTVRRRFGSKPRMVDSPGDLLQMRCGGSPDFARQKQSTGFTSPSLPGDESAGTFEQVGLS